MSKFYNSKRTRNLYVPLSEKPFKLSRSKIELFKECPRCFYIDRRLGTGRPPGFPFNLNSAVDSLLKNEFDIYRKRKEKHPLIKEYGVDAIPAQHEDLDKWRQNFTGIQYLHEPTNLLIFGAIDDLWQDSQGNYIVVDYKATSKNEKIIDINKNWQFSYKRQMEIYQWLLRKNGYDVSDTGYFVYCNGDRNKESFNGKLEFDITLIPYNGKDNWVEATLQRIHNCLNQDIIPKANSNCDYCSYIDAVTQLP